MLCFVGKCEILLFTAGMHKLMYLWWGLAIRHSLADLRVLICAGSRGRCSVTGLDSNLLYGFKIVCTFEGPFPLD